MSGKCIPIAKEATTQRRPTTASFQPERLNFFWISPNITANTINIIEMVPAQPFVFAASESTETPSFTVYALNVPATISANAAITSKVNSQQNKRKSLRPVLPMYFSISTPMDLPSFLTEA